MTELEASVMGDDPPPYMIFLVVFLFFLTGLLGFLVCHLLKKKGYRCRTGDMDDEEEEEKLGGDADENDENQDTVEQILKCIIENEANMEALNEMLGNHNVCVRHDPRLRKESIGGFPPHHHTVHSGVDHNSCHLCAQVRSKKGRRHSRTPRFKQRPGEQTVFSVGRFRVTHHDKKLHGGPNPFATSGEQLDQSQDSEDQKEDGYNLRSMFKDVRRPSESSNGVGPHVGKRRRSLTFFGLRRGSDPAGIKVGEGAGREAGGGRLAFQHQPVVLEEQLQTENTGATPECPPEPVKPETELSKNQPPASLLPAAKSLGYVGSPSSQSESQDKDSSPANEDRSRNGTSPEPGKSPMTELSTGSTVAPAPSSLPIPFPASSGEAFKKTEGGDVLKDEEVHDPGPLQASTPIAPMHESIPGFTPVIATDRPEPNSSRGFPTQTPLKLSSSPDLESGATTALASLGSSPPSSASLLKTPTTLQSVTLSPKISRNTKSEVVRADFTSSFTTPGPKYPSGLAKSSQPPVLSTSFEKTTSPLQARTPSPALTATSQPDTASVSLQNPPASPAHYDLSVGNSLHMTFKSECVMSPTAVGEGDKASSPSSVKEKEVEGARIPQREEEIDMKRAGILKTAQLPPAGGDSKTPALLSSTHQSPRDGLNSLPLSPLSPPSVSSPAGTRVSHVTIVKASPESRREFSVVTMVEEEQSSPSIADQRGEASESERDGISPVGGPGTMVSVLHVGQYAETVGAEDGPMGSQEKDDMVEMDDIKGCKVTQAEETEKTDNIY